MRAGASVTVLLGFTCVVYDHRSGDSLFCNVKPSLGGGNPPPGKFVPRNEPQLRARVRGDGPGPP